MSELKPCPFCGHEAFVDDCGDHRYFVKCSHCSINQDKLFSQKCDAIRAWNRRVKVERKRGEWIPCSERLPVEEDNYFVQKYGEWVWDDSRNYNEHFNCSECGYQLNDVAGIMKSELLPNYCPNCGARMTKE